MGKIFDALKKAEEEARLLKKNNQFLDSSSVTYTDKFKTPYSTQDKSKKSKKSSLPKVYEGIGVVWPYP